jgi:serine/threonine-protein kinase RsbW
MTEDGVGALADVADRVVVTALADPEILDLAHSVLAQLWRRHPLVPEPARLRFETALVEILGNIVEHAYRADEAHGVRGERRVEVAVGVTGAALLAFLGDNGRPAAIDLAAVTMPPPDAETGRGLPLAKAALDELAYHRDGSRNLWTLRLDWEPE